MERKCKNSKIMQPSIFLQRSHSPLVHYFIISHLDLMIALHQQQPFKENCKRLLSSKFFMKTRRHCLLRSNFFFALRLYPQNHHEAPSSSSSPLCFSSRLPTSHDFRRHVLCATATAAIRATCWWWFSSGGSATTAAERAILVVDVKNHPREQRHQHHHTA